MAVIQFRGACSGTVAKHSSKKNVDYSITRFVEYPSLRPIEIFGDLGLGAHEDFRDYVLEADITGLQNVVVHSAAPAAPAAPAKNKS